ncbi:hypothetical protein EUGRSUZ_B02885 [Eucalyptus grandis]|uniref:Thioredoxin domain-containing protein n=2 Tax=Eucalyptus grandis TaxID=71139 RepID=A0A059D7I9_EUCGR|nr:hypothetical protein EUGRSUZ_B02885 [Eucalyptus grandis]
MSLMSWIAAILLFVNLVPLSCQRATVSSSSSAVGVHSTPRAVKTIGLPADCAVELNATNFDAVLRGTPATYAVVEFFAHWCPACRNYKPQYEKLARIFNGPDAVHPGIVLMTRVDCALTINNKLCDKFSVSHYPMLFWGPHSEFIAAGWEPQQEKSKIRVIDDGRTAERLLNWINKQIGSTYVLDDEKFEKEHPSSSISDPEQIAQAVYEVEVATSAVFDIILEHKAKEAAATREEAEDKQHVEVWLQKAVVAAEE